MIGLLEMRTFIIAMICALAVGLGIGGTVMHKVDQGDYLALKKSVTEAKNKAKDAADKKAEAERKVGEALAARDAAASRLATYEFNQVRKESNYVEKTVIGQGVPAHVLPVGWVRQYNASMSAGTGAAPAAAGRADAAAGGTSAAESPQSIAAPSGFTEWDVLDNTTDNAEGYAACRRQLNRLIDWEESTTQ